MPDYRPAAPGVVVAALGTWTAPGLPARTATLTFDVRLATWLVNLAAKRGTLRYQVNNGKPPATIQLT